MVTPHSGETDSLEIVVDVIMSTSFLTSYTTKRLKLICNEIIMPELKS